MRFHAYLTLIVVGASLSILKISYLFNCCNMIPDNSKQTYEKEGGEEERKGRKEGGKKVSFLLVQSFCVQAMMALNPCL